MIGCSGLWGALHFFNFFFGAAGGGKKVLKIPEMVVIVTVRQPRHPPPVHSRHADIGLHSMLAAYLPTYLPTYDAPQSYPLFLSMHVQGKKLAKANNKPPKGEPRGGGVELMDTGRGSSSAATKPTKMGALKATNTNSSINIKVPKAVTAALKTCHAKRQRLLMVLLSNEPEQGKFYYHYHHYYMISFILINSYYFL